MRAQNRARAPLGRRRERGRAQGCGRRGRGRGLARAGRRGRRPDRPRRHAVRPRRGRVGARPGPRAAALCALRQNPLARYFAIARGAEGVAAADMSKLLDTNYHYLVPELSANSAPAPDWSYLLDRARRGQAAVGAARAVPMVVGPVSVVALARGEFDRAAMVTRLAPAYADLLAQLAELGVPEVQVIERRLRWLLCITSLPFFLRLLVAFRSPFSALPCAPHLRLRARGAVYSGWGRGPDPERARGSAHAARGAALALSFLPRPPCRRTRRRSSLSHRRWLNRKAHRSPGAHLGSNPRRHRHLKESSRGRAAQARAWGAAAKGQNTTHPRALREDPPRAPLPAPPGAPRPGPAPGAPPMHLLLLRTSSAAPRRPRARQCADRRRPARPPADPR